MKFERSREEISNDVAEIRSILKSYQSAFFPRFIRIYTETAKNSLKLVSRFYYEDKVRLSASPYLCVVTKDGTRC